MLPNRVDTTWSSKSRFWHSEKQLNYNVKYSPLKTQVQRSLCPCHGTYHDSESGARPAVSQKRPHFCANSAELELQNVSPGAREEENISTNEIRRQQKKHWILDSYMPHARSILKQEATSKIMCPCQQRKKWLSRTLDCLVISWLRC